MQSRNYLSSRFSGKFGAKIRTRGAQIADSAVTIREGNARRVLAIVEGSNEYEVELSIEGGRFVVGCTCPSFESTGPCKHIYATMRRAERAGYLLSAGTGARLDFVERGVKLPEMDEDFDEWEDEIEDWGPVTVPKAVPKLVPPTPRWRDEFARVYPATVHDESRSAGGWPASRRIAYVLDAKRSMQLRRPLLELTIQDRKKNGEWSALKTMRLRKDELSHLPDAADREALAMLCGSTEERYSYSYYDPYPSVPSAVILREPLAEHVFAVLDRAGKLQCRTDDSHDPKPLSLDAAEPWRPVLTLRRGQKSWELVARLQRGDDTLALHEPEVLIPSGWLISGGRLSKLEWGYAVSLLDFLRREGCFHVPFGQEHEFLAELYKRPDLPVTELPEELQVEEVSAAPRPVLLIEPRAETKTKTRLTAALQFAYAGVTVPLGGAGSALYDASKRTLRRRDKQAEEALLSRLQEAGFRPLPLYLRTPGFEWEIAPAKLTSAVRDLTAEHWLITVEGAVFRQAKEVDISVSTGIDWFDVAGTVDFGPAQATLPQLLEALRRGEDSIALSDGSVGIIPEDWLRQYGLLAATGQAKDGGVRFRRSQAALLDVLLAAQPKVSVDEGFARIRQELKSFDGIGEAPQPDGFQGSLRGYQREGLGWFEFLQRFGLGGCLADDMGVGKTIQVLALLENRRRLRAGDSPAGGDRPGPSLVVAPRSVIFNWIEEARRFTPGLRTLDYTGAGRTLDGVADCDLVITTYGTLRRDIVKLKGVAFDYAILDEAQAIKNAKTASAKAARLLEASHRLALTGTPVENHLGELWSIFEFLNPGMLGASSLWQSTNGTVRPQDPALIGMMRGALRPYILRRTKGQVAAELPEKFEQTYYCELENVQRWLYSELREHSRGSRLGRVADQGLARSKMHVLEALLRLRQAACHPGLLDRERAAGPSAKLDSLLPMLEEIVAEGHKALVFSQFTSFLALLVEQLKQRPWGFEYLDGKTKDRQARVDRFQSDADCRLFLISLKAGGLGLNLTAADYVFLLDPWWNPAVEAQAIDRAHRIGQSRQVFAYRLIARDTVEEKVLELQNTKRDLAEAIISEDNSVLRNLSREDLELLLS